MGIPSGDRLKLEKVSIPKGMGGTEFGISAIIGGYTITQFGGPGMLLYGYGISAIGVLVTAFIFINGYNPYRKLFENTNLMINDVMPKYRGKKTTDYGYCLTFSLPAGMSTDDFKKRQLAIEQNLNKRIDISYNNYKVFIRVFEKELEKLIPYEFIETKNKLEFPIGKVFGGKTVTVDLEKVTHLLIAGETGSGKSTLLRGIITSLILSNKRIALHLIDLKNGAEFNVFRKCSKVNTFTKTKEDAEVLLNKLIKEVDRRYEIFFENDVVDINEYNRLKNVKRLDSQIVIIDEFADLQKEKDSISSIEVLAAKARACGIHLIIATQRPDANIINGRIKANIPSSIGFRTKNELNSRIIIDEGGLEKLRGKGHGIFQFTNSIEFQSMYITNEQARDLVKHTYVEKKPSIIVKEEPKEIKDFSFLQALEGGISGSD